MPIDVQQLELPLQIFARRANNEPNQVYLRQPRDGIYHETTWFEAYDQTRRLAAGLRAIGLQPGDKVALLSQNCTEWFISDFAITAAGMISVPIYFTAGEDTIRYILEHSEARAIIVGKLASHAAVEAAVPEGIKTIAMPYETMQCEHQTSQMIEQNEPLESSTVPDLDDVFSITYTSGSTGRPKGVVLTFRNIVFGGASGADLLKDYQQLPRVISYLPLAHITERALVEYGSLYTGGVVTFNDSLSTFLDDLKSARVNFFISVPRLWLKFQSGVLAKMPQKKLDRMLRIPVLSGIVKRKIKKQLGLSEVINCGSGSAPISPSILEWYHKLGIEISEGWGMTEVSGMATSQFPFRADKLGTIGHAVEGLEIKVSEQGELLVRGDAVFTAYYKNPEATRETFTEDGFLKTGDKAEMDEDGYFRITGRVKDLFKSAKGKYIAPVPIESKMGANQLIDQICVMGSGLQKAIAVIGLAPEVVDGLSREEISESLLNTMDEVNATLEKHEVLGGLRIAAKAWTIENGLLTPTLKIKRAELEDMYKDFIAVESEQRIIWE